MSPAATAARLRLGFLYPGHAAEDDLDLLVQALFADGRVVSEVVHTSVGEDAHRIDALRDLGSARRLNDGADDLRAREAAVAVWACTSGSFVFGWDGAREQADELQRHFGAPASSTSLAFVGALKALGVERVAIAATYPALVTDCLVELLSAAGVDVLGASSQGIVTAEEVGRLRSETLVAFVSAADRPQADAVLVPDTALHTVRSLKALRAAVGKPVLTANQVTVWEALRLAAQTESDGELADALRDAANTALLEA